MTKNYINLEKHTNSQISFGFFTRNGGLSLGNFSSLNCSLSSGDQKNFVKKNILKAQKELLIHNKKIKFVNQNHSNKVIIIDKNNYSNKFEADGIITEDKDICIAILTADCCPILIFDDENKFICCLHAGWKGVYSNIIKNAIDQIIKIQPNLIKINAIIGPCLNKKNFEVSEDFKYNFLNVNSDYKNFFSITNKSNKFLFDMRKLIKFQLKSNNIVNIKNINIDTYSNEDLFFSHRRATHLNQLPTGRMINLISFSN